jgi:hypothetical protein
MAQKSKDGWNSMREQPHECSGCGRKVRISKDTITFRRYPDVETLCVLCAPSTVIYSYCGCEACKVAKAAAHDASEAHRSWTKK